MNKIFWTLLIVCTIIFKSYSLQGGPVQPDYVQFEPVDNTDLVNLATGDFSYTIPLGEASAPNGGFPVVLSYHAGIQHDQEATWVGLGWTLNLGAINRVLRGYPDDWYDGVVQSEFYDYGEHSEGWGVNVGVGYGPIGLSMNYDSEKGFGMNATLGVKLSNNVSLGLSVGSSGANVGLNGFGFSVGVGTEGVSFGASKGFASATATIGWDGTKSVSLSAKVGIVSGGYTFSSKGSGGSFSIAGTGFSSQSGGTNMGSVQTWSSNWGFTIPIPIIPIPGLSFSIGYYEWEFDWWLNEAIDEHAYGYLYQGGPASYSDPYLLALYKGADPDRTNQTYVDVGAKIDQYETKDHLIYPAQDLYSVSCQGISGSFKPYGTYDMKFITDINKRTGRSMVFKDNGNVAKDVSGAYKPDRWKYNNYDVLIENYINYRNKMVIASTVNNERLLNSGMQFRFLNDAGANLLTMPRGTDYEFYSSASYLNFTNNTGLYADGLPDGQIENSIGNTNPRYGSKRIIPITTHESGVLEGYDIIDTDGKRYRFIKPVYSFLEMSYVTDQKNNEPKSGNSGTFSKIFKQIPYATSWLITDIFGPDFVNKSEGISNRGENGDLGFWVHFTYVGDRSGEYSAYKWRSPFSTTGENALSSIEKNRDGDDKKKYSCSYGYKEFVYLENIETATDMVKFNILSRKDFQTLDDKRYPASIFLGILHFSSTHYYWENDAGDVVYEPTSKYIRKMKKCFSAPQTSSESIEKTKLSLEDKKYLGTGWVKLICGNVTRKVTTCNLTGLRANIALPKNFLSKIEDGTYDDLNIFKITVKFLNDSKNNRSITKKYSITGKMIDKIVLNSIDNYNRRKSRYTIYLNDGFRVMTDIVYDFKFRNSVNGKCVEEASMTAERLNYKFELHEDALDKCYKTDNIGRKLNNITFHKKSNKESTPYKTVKFNYDYSLCKNTPNSTGDGGGKLTLKSIQTFGKEMLPLPPYKFEYGFNPSYKEGSTEISAFYKHDYWGMHNKNATEFDKFQTQNATEGVCWNLEKITTPSGGELNIYFERDKYVGISPNQARVLVTGIVDDATINAKNYYDASLFSMVGGKNTLTLNEGHPNPIGEFYALLKMKRHTQAKYYNTTQHRWSPFYSYWSQYEYGLVQVSITSNSLDFTIIDSKVLEQREYYNYYGNPKPKYISNLSLEKIELMSVNNDMEVYGGNVRVKLLQSNDGLGNIVSTNYEYGQGYLFSDPAYSENSIKLRNSNGVYKDVLPEFKAIFYSLNKHDNFNFEAPSGGVIYSQVTVTTKSSDNKPLDGRTIFKYWTANDKWYNGCDLYKTPSDIGSEGDKLEIVDYSGIVGRLKSIEKQGWYDINGDKVATNNEYKTVYSDIYTYMSSDGTYSDGLGDVLKLNKYSILSPSGHIKGGTASGAYLLGATVQKWEQENEYVKSGSSTYNGDGVLVKDLETNEPVQPENVKRSFEHKIYNPFLYKMEHKSFFDPTSANSKVLTVTVENSMYDAFTGRPLVTKTTNSGGKTKIVNEKPAYFLGLGNTTESHYGTYVKMYLKNMLLQNYKEKTWSTNMHSLANIENSKITLWKTFYEEDGFAQIYTKGTYVARADLNIKDAVMPTTTIFNIDKNIWIGSTVKKYDPFGHALVEQSPNGIVSSVLYGNNNSKPIAIISNASAYSYQKIAGNQGAFFGDCAYTGFENTLGLTDMTDKTKNNGWHVYNQNEIVNYNSKTGIYSCLVKIKSPNSYGFGPTTDLIPNKKNGQLKASVWCKTTEKNKNVKLIITNQKHDVKSDGWEVDSKMDGMKYNIATAQGTGDWELLEVEISLLNLPKEVVRVYVQNESDVNAFFDDFRVYPDDSKMTTFTYDPDLLKVTSITGPDNKTQSFEYDGLGRLIAKRNSAGKITSTGSYYLKK